MITVLSNKKVERTTHLLTKRRDPDITRNSLSEFVQSTFSRKKGNLRVRSQSNEYSKKGFA